MDKAIIYDVFEFTGFHFCKRLLEKGYHVNGIHFNTKSDFLLAEKRLEIGRNANFSEKNHLDLENFIEKDGSESAIIIISLYEWFMAFKEAPLSNTEMLAQMVQSLNDRQKAKNQLVYLLPIQLLTNLQDVEGVVEIKEFIDQTNKLGECIQLFYLPTIFGPWQPSSFLFQRALFKQLNTTKDDFIIREWPLDAIFIDDALDPIIDRIETGKKGSFLLESGIPDSWDRCADFLKLDQSIRSKLAYESMDSDDQIVKLTLKQVTSYQKSLTIQREHLSRVCNLQDES